MCRRISRSRVVRRIHADLAVIEVTPARSRASRSVPGLSFDELHSASPECRCCPRETGLQLGCTAANESMTDFSTGYMPIPNR